MGMPRAFAVTLTLVSAQAIGINARRCKLIFHNPNAVALVAICPDTNGANSAPLPAVVNGAGSIVLLPRTQWVIDTSLPSQIPLAWNAVSDTNGAALTILEIE